MEGLKLRLKYIENSKRGEFLTDNVIMSSYAALNYCQSVKLMKYYKAVQSHRKKWGHSLSSIGWLFEPSQAK